MTEDRDHLFLPLPDRIGLYVDGWIELRDRRGLPINVPDDDFDSDDIR